ncbi:MAG: class I SAM-dependent methyltransferase [Planctomycetota bacterium]
MRIPARPCTACGARAAHEFLRLEQMPTRACALWATRSLAEQCARGDITLAYCERCGLIENTTFAACATVHDQGYENALHFSPVFQQYAAQLAGTLVERFALRNKTIVEIGCGDGHFLELLCLLGANRGLGFDPSFDPRRTGGPRSGRVTIVADCYRHDGAAADAFIARQVFEHLPHPARFLARLRGTIGSHQDALVFFEVPNALKTLDDDTVWDVIYEHCSSFTAGSLAGMFARCGFEVAAAWEAYGGQFLAIAAHPSRSTQGTTGPASESPGRVRAAVVRFARTHRDRIAAARRRIEALARTGKRAVLWGAGARGVSFLNLVGARTIRYVVDINPRKHGKFIPGTGQEIVAPDFLRRYQPEVVIIMNPNYTGEIERDLARLGLRCEVIHP